MAPPQTNATITAVHGAGVADDWDRAGGDGPEKWAGSERAYFRRRGDRVTDGGAVTIIDRDELIAEVAWVLAASLDTDDAITFVLDEAPDSPVQRTPQAIPIKTLPGIPAGLQTSRIALEALA